MIDAPPISQTILFADIAGSAALYDRLGDATARRLVAAAIGCMKTAVRANAGQVIKTIGDEVMCAFTTVDAAVLAAIAMQEAVAADRQLADHTVRLRIGFHYGAVIVEDGDLFGNAVNVASRMTALAKAGQIISSRQTVDRLPATRRDTARLVDQARIKGKAEPIDYFELPWGQPDDMTVALRDSHIQAAGAKPDRTGMVLEWQGNRLRLDAALPAISLGRDKSNLVVIQDSKVSRLHAQLEIRKDKVVLADKSTNGTYVHPLSGEPLHLHRDEMVLAGSGYLSLGSVGEPDSPNAIAYRIDTRNTPT